MSSWSNQLPASALPQPHHSPAPSRIAYGDGLEDGLAASTVTAGRCPH